MTWEWLKFKNLGIIIKARFGGASEKEKAAFKARWDKKCGECAVPKWDHAAANHNFVEPKETK